MIWMIFGCMIFLVAVIIGASILRNSARRDREMANAAALKRWGLN